MLVIIDESGDTGFKKSSSPYFIMSMVVFDDNNKGRYAAAEHTARTIADIKHEVHQKPEFHFSKCSHKTRTAFFEGLNTHNCRFDVYALVIDKQKIYSPQLKNNSKNFYNFILKQLLKQNPIKQAVVKIDGTKSKTFQRALKAYLRHGQDGMVSKLKFANSKTDYLVQLADMCCSGIAYSYSRPDKAQSDDYVELLGSRIKNIWKFS